MKFSLGELINVFSLENRFGLQFIYHYWLKPTLIVIIRSGTDYYPYKRHIDSLLVWAFTLLGLNEKDQYVIF